MEGVADGCGVVLADRWFTVVLVAAAELEVSCDGFGFTVEHGEGVARGAAFSIGSDDVDAERDFTVGRVCRDDVYGVGLESCRECSWRAGAGASEGVAGDGGVARVQGGLDCLAGFGVRIGFRPAFDAARAIGGGERVSDGVELVVAEDDVAVVLVAAAESERGCRWGWVRGAGADLAGCKEKSSKGKAEESEVEVFQLASSLCTMLSGMSRFRWLVPLLRLVNHTAPVAHLECAG